MLLTVRIFLSYDDTARDIAQRIALGLRAGGHRVFFDQDSLPAGTSYDERIRNAIGRSHLLVFLINSESVRKGAYALTELAIAERRWAHPDGRVLPVLLDDTPIPSLPPYLRAVSVLHPTGDVVADTLAAVATLVAERRNRIARRGVAAVAIVLALAALVPLSGRLRGEGGGAPDTGVPVVVDEVASERTIEGTAERTSAPSTHRPADRTAEPPEPDDVPAAPEDADNPRTWKLKNDRHVRLIGSIVSNQSNVAGVIIKDAVEWSAWRYNRCYDAAFGHLEGELPEGAVTVSFEIRDQLPRAVTVQQSDFGQPQFEECIVGTVVGQTLNAAGPTGAGPVTYAFRFLPN